MFRMKIFVPLFFALTVCLSFIIKWTVFESPKKTYAIETSDISRFWKAYDSLKNCHSFTDSANIIQSVYLDNMSTYGKKYIQKREYTAQEYIRTLKKYPQYFKELRVKTQDMSKHNAEIDSAFRKLNRVIPDFSYPDVCFAIGCFRGGGTISKDKHALLIGSEIALADSNMNISEFKGTLYHIFSHSDGQITDLVTHESVHCQQWNGKDNSLLSLALLEGTAEFIKGLAVPSQDNGPTERYARAHECELWQQFKADMHGQDISKWLYNTSPNESRPADLGYFIGRRICETYYNSQPDKQKAIKTLLNRANYQAVLDTGGYNGSCKK